MNNFTKICPSGNHMLQEGRKNKIQSNRKIKIKNSLEDIKKQNEMINGIFAEWRKKTKGVDEVWEMKQKSKETIHHRFTRVL